MLEDIQQPNLTELASKAVSKIHRLALGTAISPLLTTNNPNRLQMVRDLKALFKAEIAKYANTDINNEGLFIDTMVRVRVPPLKPVYDFLSGDFTIENTMQDERYFRVIVDKDGVHVLQAYAMKSAESMT